MSRAYSAISHDIITMHKKAIKRQVFEVMRIFVYIYACMENVGD